MAKLVFSMVLLMALSTCTWTARSNIIGFSNEMAATPNKYLESCLLTEWVTIIGRTQVTFEQPMFDYALDYVEKVHQSAFNNNSAVIGCLNLIPKDLTALLTDCSKLNGGAECEIINRIVAAKKCSSGFSRLTTETFTDSTACYQDCPAGFATQGPICTKPDSYVLNNFRNELECIANNNNKPCSIYHVRYFVPDCKEGFYRLGSTVCIPLCPDNFEDHESFCVRPTIQTPKEQTARFNWRYIA